jgi:kinesin family protein 18/19
LDEHVVVFDPADTDNGSLSASIGNSQKPANSKGFANNFHRARDYKYAFDRVFDAYATQEEVYRHTTQDLISSVMNGYNATVFAYGATGNYLLNSPSFLNDNLISLVHI